MTASAAQRRDCPNVPLIGLLAFTSGGVDAVMLMAVGGSFTSVMTGNLNFIGRAVGTFSPGTTMYVALAITGYSLGVAAGSRFRHEVAGQTEAHWPRRVTGLLALQLLVLAAVNAIWIAYQADPPAPAVGVLLTAAALSLGLQAAAARGVRGNPSTSYMTGVLTELVETVATRGWRSVKASAAVTMPMLVLGAACSALLTKHVPQAALLPPLASLLLVVVIKQLGPQSPLPGRRAVGWQLGRAPARSR